MSDKYFGGNFSAYLTYLVFADQYYTSRVENSNVNKNIDKGKIAESIDGYIKCEKMKIILIAY